MSRYLDPKADVVFKKIFGEHSHILKHFLNAVLPLAEDAYIRSLEYLTPEQVPLIPSFKQTIVDVKCTDQQGRIFIVEMQMDWVAGFKERMLFNSAHAYVKQLQKNEKYESLCPVYGLGIVNANFEEGAEWYHHYKIVNVKKPSKTLKGLELVFLELPKFNPTTKAERVLRILWLRFLSELDENTKQIPLELLEVPEIREACELSEEAAFSAGELEAYHKYWDLVRTEKTRIYGAFELGKAEGEVIGLEKGQAMGLEKGEAIGFEKGKLERDIAIAKNLSALGIGPEDIAKVTGLPMTEVEIIIRSKVYT